MKISVKTTDKNYKPVVIKRCIIACWILLGICLTIWAYLQGWRGTEISYSWNALIQSGWLWYGLYNVQAKRNSRVLQGEAKGNRNKYLLKK